MVRIELDNIDIQFRYLAYEEWKDQQSPELEDSPWKWYLNYLGKPRSKQEEESLLRVPP